MRFDPPLQEGRLLQRYKRFLADVVLDSGEVVTAHCTNSGSMKSCLEEGAEVYLSPVNDPTRKTKFTWEMIRINNGWVGINTSNPNRLAYEYVTSGLIPGIEGYTNVRREVTYGDSRFDLYAERESEKCFIEVKNVTLKEGKYALFPDAETSRGRKHLETLISIKKEGMRAIMLYIVQRTDVEIFAPAWDIDPFYAETLVRAHANGVEIFPFRVEVSPQRIMPSGLLPYRLDKE